MADTDLLFDREPDRVPPPAYVFESISGRQFVDVRETIFTRDQMNRLCSWWIQYIAEHPQPEVKEKGI